MAYPERGAGYEHNPKFIERMKAEERARGGKTDDPIPGGWQHEGENVGQSLNQEADWRKQDLDNAMGARQYEPGVSNAGQGPTPSNLKNLNYERQMGFPENYRHGGKVRKGD